MNEELSCHSPGASCALGDATGQRRARVRLRVEYVTNIEAALLSWVVFSTTIAMLGGIIAGAIVKFIFDPQQVLFQQKSWYTAHVVVASVLLAILLALAVMFAVNLCFARYDRRIWDRRRLGLTRDAGLMLCIQVLCVTCWLASYALVLARPCAWFQDPMAILASMRWSAINIQFLWMLVMAHGNTRYRGGGDAAADYQLVMDAPWVEQLRLHLPKLPLWLLTQACLGWKTQDWFNTSNDLRHFVEPYCDNYPYSCNPGVMGILTTALLFVLFLAYALAYLLFMRRAFQDHDQLPFAHYRLSNMYIRIMMRHGTMALFTVIASMLLLQLIHYKSCWSYLDMSLGALTIQVALVLLVAVQAILLMPKNTRSRDALLAWQQELSWTQAGLAAAMERRDYRLRRAQFALSADMFARSQRARHAMRDTRSLLAKLGLLGQEDPEGGAGAPDAAPASEASLQPNLGHRLGHVARQGTRMLLHLGQHHEGPAKPEPMLCLELAIRLWSWAQYSYRHWWVDGGMDLDWLMSLFSFTKFEAYRDAKSDTRLVMAWREGCLLLSFRGTASRANAMTDLKAWKAPLLPRRFHQGLPVRVHAGFLQAYRTNEEGQRLLPRIADIVAGFSPAAGLRLYVTGHSLGGALAVLAAHDLARAYPQAEITCTTFGAPKVGNRAFAAEFHGLVPDSWSVVCAQDPVPRVPTTGFRCCGQRVILSGRGDILVRPSYFERSIINRSGGNPGHHRMPRYALAFAQVIRAQFTPSKALQGGVAGAEALALGLDLGKTLLLTNMDLASLHDAAAQPQWTGAAGMKARPSQRRGCGFGWCAVCDVCEDSTASAMSSLEDELEESSTPAGPAPSPFCGDPPKLARGSPPSAQQAAAEAVECAISDGEEDDKLGKGQSEDLETGGGGGWQGTSDGLAAPPGQPTRALPPAHQLMRSDL